MCASLQEKQSHAITPPSQMQNSLILSVIDASTLREGVDHTDHFWHHPSTSLAVVVWKTVNQHLIPQQNPQQISRLEPNGNVGVIGAYEGADHTGQLWHHPSTSPAVIVWKRVGQHLFLNKISTSFMARTGRKCWCDRGIWGGWSHWLVLTPSISISGCNSVKIGGATSISQHNPQQNNFMAKTGRKCWCDLGIWGGWSHRPVLTPSINISGCNNVKSGGPTSISQHNPQQSNFMAKTGREMLVWSGHMRGLITPASSDTIHQHLRL